MTKIPSYKGYTAGVEIDVDEGIITGTVLGLRDIIHFQADNVAGIEPAFHLVVDEYLAWCEEEGIDPEKPYSGKIHLRMTPELHRELALTAEGRNESLNSVIIEACTNYVASSREK